MSKHIKYKVKIPIPDTNPVEYTERFFVDKKDVCAFLEIDQGTFQSICSGILKYKQNRIKHLEGLIIEKIIKAPTNKNKAIDKPIDQHEFLNKLIQKTVN
jgi:hypothetical protein